MFPGFGKKTIQSSDNNVKTYSYATLSGNQFEGNTDVDSSVSAGHIDHVVDFVGNDWTNHRYYIPSAGTYKIQANVQVQADFDLNNNYIHQIEGNQTDSLYHIVLSIYKQTPQGNSLLFTSEMHAGKFDGQNLPDEDFVKFPISALCVEEFNAGDYITIRIKAGNSIALKYYIIALGTSAFIEKI